MAQITTVPPTLPAAERRELDRGRYRRVMRFFTSVFISIIWWEVVLRAVLGERVVSRGRTGRMRNIARRFRALAVRMGGVMIKLGQFISTRVDVIPHEIIDELAGLQDEVPPEDLDVMLALLESELGQPADQLFAEFDTSVQAAASLGQVYRARLKTGERVAVKIQRPGIEKLIATDLEALRVVAGWAMYWKVVRRRADVPALLQEFARTLWEEVDYEAEARNAERFQELFADDLRVYIPRVYPQYSTRRVLTMEDVTSIKITDHAAIDAAGVDRAVAARRLLDLYLQMIFDFGFFHADPHPGNLFIYPLPDSAVKAMYDRPPDHPGRPFYIVFVDFGMVGHITDRVMEGLREALIALGTRDHRRMVRAYQTLGILLPSADVDRIAEADAEVLDMVWGKSVQEVAQMSQEDMRRLALRYADLLYEMPFQVPQDFIYLGRALGILSGICTLLDPNFNPWEPIGQYAQRIVAREARTGAGEIAREALSVLGRAFSLPGQTQDVLTRLERGELTVRFSPDDELNRRLARIESSIVGLTRTLLASGLLVAGALLYSSGSTLPGIVAFGLAGLSWLSAVLRRRSPRR